MSLELSRAQREQLRTPLTSLMPEVHRDGDFDLSNAMIGGRFALRACIVNYWMAPQDVEQLLAPIRRVAARISRAV